MESNDYAVFIISHGRPECRTYNKYLGGENCYIVCDDEDETLPEYQRRYGDKVIVYHRDEYIQKTDWQFNQVKRNHSVYPRNACYDLAKKIGRRYFFVVDDDMKVAPAIRSISEGELKSYRPKDLYKVLGAYVEFMRGTDIAIVGVGGSGDFIGGAAAITQRPIAYTLQNFYLCDVARPVEFKSLWVDDYTASVLGWMQGKMTIVPKMVMAVFSVGENSTADYVNDYSYNFAPVVLAPASIRLYRKHGKFENWLQSNYFPVIIDERWKK